MSSARQRFRLLQAEAKRQRSNAFCLFEIVQVLGSASVDTLLASLRVAGTQGELVIVHDQLSSEVNASNVIWRLPAHLLACSMSGEPGGHWQNEENQMLTDRTAVQGVGCTEHLERGLLLLRKLFVAAPYRPKIKQVMYKNEEWTNMLIDLILHILLKFAAPKTWVHATLYRGDVDKACLEAKLVAGSLALVSVAYHHDSLGFKWEHTACMLLRHPCSGLFAVASFDATTGIVKAAAQLLLEPHNKVHLQDLCVSAEIAMESLSNLVAVPIYFEFLLKCKETGMSPVMRLIHMGIVGIETICNDEELGGNIPTPVHRILDWSFVIFQTLAEHESPSFLDKMCEQLDSGALNKELLLDTSFKITRRFNMILELPKRQYLLENRSFCFLMLNLLRVVDTLAEDSNCSCILMQRCTASLVYVLSLPCETFQSIWCCQNSRVLPYLGRPGIQWERIEPVSLQAKFESKVLWNAVVSSLDTNLDKESAKLQLTERTARLWQCLLLFKIISSLSHFNPDVMNEKQKEMLLRLMRVHVKTAGVEFWKTKALANLNALFNFVQAKTHQLIPEEDKRIFQLFVGRISTFDWHGEPADWMST